MSVSLSVALCTLNGASFIGEQLYSILNQRLPVQEIVICDDGSSDETLDIIGSFSKKYPQIKWQIHKNTERRGVTKNFEQALSLCRGDIVFLADQDDIWFSEKTTKIVKYLKQNPDVDLVFTNALLINAASELLSEATLFDVCGINSLKLEWERGLQFEIENVIQRLVGATFGIRRSFLSRCTPFHPEVHNYHDGQIAMQAIADHRIGFIDECLIKYRLHSNNVVGLGWRSGNNDAWQTRKWRAELLEPRAVNPFFLLPCASLIYPRVRFYIKRCQNYSHIKGKVILLGSVFNYIKYYNQLWFIFYSSDLLYGVSMKLRSRLINRWEKQ